MSVDGQVSYPIKGKSGWYVLSDGRKVRGAVAAEAAEKVLGEDVPGLDPVPELLPSTAPVLGGHGGWEGGELVVTMFVPQDAVPSFVDVEQDMGEPVVPPPRPVEGHSADMVVVDDPTPVPVTFRGTVFVDCTDHPSGNGTGLAAPHDLTTVVDHSFCPAVV